jgi:hypothetical protein
MPCDAVLRDEFNHTYKITGNYTLEWGDWRTFNYTDKVEILHNDYCCSYGLHKQDTVWVYWCEDV